MFLAACIATMGCFIWREVHVIPYAAVFKHKPMQLLRLSFDTFGAEVYTSALTPSAREMKDD